MFHPDLITRERKQMDRNPASPDSKRLVPGNTSRGTTGLKETNQTHCVSLDYIMGPNKD